MAAAVVAYFSFTPGLPALAYLWFGVSLPAAISQIAAA